HFFKPLDIQTMNKAAALSEGEHDFECFSKVKTDVNRFLCNVKSANWKSQGSRLIIHSSANRFLRWMVRAVVGTLLDVGTGKISLRDFRLVLQSRDRRKAGPNVPAHGLYLVRVRYPASIFVK